MKPRNPFSRAERAAVVGGLVAVTVIALVAVRHDRDDSTARSATVTVPAVPVRSTIDHGIPDKLVLRPLPVSLKTAKHEWTKEDAKVPEVIQKLVHNPDEFFRMVEENDRIKRRQLVYRNETVPMLIERLGDSHLLRSFMLPGLDGKEIEIEVKEIHEEPSLGGGSVIGRVKGRFNSMVSVGYVNGCESFNVISPDDGLCLTADAREPGEVIVKEIDLDKYAPPGGGEPDFILTQQPVPHGHTH